MSALSNTSRTRNRSSGDSSASSHQGNFLVDTSSEAASTTRVRSGRSFSKPRSRSVSPPWEGPSSNSFTLLPVANQNADLVNGSHYCQDDIDSTGDEHVGIMTGWRLGEGTTLRVPSARTRDGKLGCWLWNTQRGWMVYVGLLIAIHGNSSLALLVMNRFILWTGVYKYPITTTCIELCIVQILLHVSASITRSFSRSLYSLGFGQIVAPHQKLSKNYRPNKSGGLRDFAYGLPERILGGILEFRLAEARAILPLAIVYSLKIILSNLSFAYTQIQIYQISRVISLLLCLVLSYFFDRSQSLSVTTLSSCITMTLSLGMASLRPGTRFAIEGFVAGVFSTLFVAGYPVLLTRTFNYIMQKPRDTGNSCFVDSAVGLGSDNREETRYIWKLMHYVNILSILIVLPWVILSGELRDISRNCYFLDVAFFWLMMIGAGTCAWATFVSGLLLIRATSPLTMIVTTYPRSAFQTVLLMGFKLPTWSWVGVFMCWGSSVWYFLGRRRECGISFFSIEEHEGALGRRGRTRT